MKLSPNWQQGASIVEKAVQAMSDGDFSQPIKPYLRFKEPANRIIAMPSFIGGTFDAAGIKWIASFPNNTLKNRPRAHSLTILNSESTGEPLAIINSRPLSGIRTAAVSGFFLSKAIGLTDKKSLRVGVCGFGVIGKLHLSMIETLFGEHISEIKVFDQNINQATHSTPERVEVVESWQEAYQHADVFITCTTALKPYIDIPPKTGSIHLNVSLRDYHYDVMLESKHIVIDDWQEVCREGTDIFRAHQAGLLDENQTTSLLNFNSPSFLQSFDPEDFNSNSFFHFNPMGMSVFDIAFAKRVYDCAVSNEMGQALSTEYANV